MKYRNFKHLTSEYFFQLFISHSVNVVKHYPRFPSREELMTNKVLKVLVFSLLFSAHSYGSQFLKCVTEDFQRVFVLSPMLKKDLFAPGKHRDKGASFALIRMKYQGKVLSQELNNYKVTENKDVLKIKAKSRFQNNFIARAILTKILKRVPDFRIKLSLDIETQDGSGQISLLENNADSTAQIRNKYEVYCKKY